MKEWDEHGDSSPPPEWVVWILVVLLAVAGCAIWQSVINWSK